MKDTDQICSGWGRAVVFALLAFVPSVAPQAARAAQCFSTSTGGIWTNAGSWEAAIPADDTATDLARIRDGATVTLDAARSVGAVIVGTSNEVGSATLDINSDLTVGTLDVYNGASFFGGDKDSDNVTRQAAGTTVTIGGKMSLAPDAGGTSAYTLGSGATLDANNGIWIGHNTTALGGTGSLTIDGGTVNVNNNPLYVGNGTLVIANGGTLNANNSNVWLHVGWLGGSGSFALNSGSVVVTNQFMVGAHGTSAGTQDAGELGVNGVFYLGGFSDNLTAGTGTYTQVGGTVTVSGYPALGALNFNGGGKNSGIYNLNGGTLVIGADGGAGIKMGGGSGQGIFNFNGGTLKAGATNADFMAGLSSANFLGNGGTVDDGGFAITIGQALGGGGALTKAGAGTLTLSASNTYAGGTMINAGTAKAGNANAFSTGAVTLNGGTLDLSTYNFANSVVLSNAANAIWVNGFRTVSGKVSGDGGFTVGGINTPVLGLTNPANDFAGNMTINAATYLMAGSTTVGEVIPNTCTITNNGNLRLEMNNGVETIAGLAGNGSVWRPLSSSGSFNLLVGSGDVIHSVISNCAFWTTVIRSQS